MMVSTIPLIPFLKGRGNKKLNLGDTPRPPPEGLGPSGHPLLHWRPFSFEKLQN